ncbi:YqzE family protein [Paenibacillus kobensis]|uniref:YqzE family protein n=1 Tax=Paenibacillus kobensis TaxID=59841 RepID=UPI000FDC3116|nr:YqzE family protein [Paenibacillus kobensis]
MADKRDELIKYVAGQFVTYIDTPSEVRKQKRMDKQAARAVREPWTTRWFGIAPLSLTLWFQGWRSRKPQSGAIEETEWIQGR